MNHQPDCTAGPGLRTAAAIADDRKEPCARRSAPKLRECTKRANIGILHHVLAEHRITGEVAGEVISSAQMRQDQAFELVYLGGAGRNCARRRALGGPAEEEEGGNLLHGLTPSSSSLHDDGARHV